MTVITYNKASDVWRHWRFRNYCKSGVNIVLGLSHIVCICFCERNTISWLHAADDLRGLIRVKSRSLSDCATDNCMLHCANMLFCVICNIPMAALELMFTEQTNLLIQSLCLMHKVTSHTVVMVIDARQTEVITGLTDYRHVSSKSCN